MYEKKGFCWREAGFLYGWKEGGRVFVWEERILLEGKGFYMDERRDLKDKGRGLG